MHYILPLVCDPQHTHKKQRGAKEAAESYNGDPVR